VQEIYKAGATPCAFLISQAEKQIVKENRKLLANDY